MKAKDLEAELARVKKEARNLRKDLRDLLAREAISDACATQSAADARALREIIRSAGWHLDAGHTKAARELLAEWGGDACSV